VNLRFNDIADDDARLSFTSANLMTSVQQVANVGYGTLMRPTVTQSIDTLLVGDMFYDAEFGARLHAWLRELLRANERLEIFIGDPDRHALPK